MSTAYKAQNFVTAASFAKRLIQGNFGSAQKPAGVVDTARKLLQACEQKGSDVTPINFDPRASVEDFKLCASSLTPIVPSDPTVRCPFCGSSVKAQYRGQLCETCQLSELGANTLGIQLRIL
eukprot:NODE_19282_length_850_cov_31.737206.p2 GENE.NODE_19282_length_850_cov_31.737206~~NODE_19282_length_850_cov_31.737206.p2  ORF type:complete len:136 (-),score=33.02 NODE_19282_length_850_cov_31.737206:441-806(-)